MVLHIVIVTISATLRLNVTATGFTRWAWVEPDVHVHGLDTSWTWRPQVEQDNYFQHLSTHKINCQTWKINNIENLVDKATAYHQVYNVYKWWCQTSPQYIFSERAAGKFWKDLLRPSLASSRVENIFRPTRTLKYHYFLYFCKSDQKFV